MIEWFDDLALGMRFKSGNVQITESDIKRFAAEYDPQPMHLDEAAAAKTVFKGLAASGWHTAAIAMNLAVQIRPFGPHPLIGMGVDELRWMAPVRPGDTLHLEGEVYWPHSIANKAARHRAGEMDCVQSEWRGRLYLHPDRYRSSPTPINLGRRPYPALNHISRLAAPAPRPRR
jgi:acyl dehydratase